jgi:hypothetical protein
MVVVSMDGSALVQYSISRLVRSFSSSSSSLRSPSWPIFYVDFDDMKTRA